MVAFAVHSENKLLTFIAFCPSRSFLLDAVSGILLIIAIVMPGRQPDIKQRVPEPSLEQCEQEAHAYLLHGMPNGAPEEAIGIAATCYVPRQPET